jgi:transcriptional regulator GlxA family with amidase domain
MPDRTHRSAAISSSAAYDEAAFERHYSVEELTELWGMSDDFVRRLFLHEPGVMIFYRPQPGKRVYRTLRIPASVALRVHRRLRTV